MYLHIAMQQTPGNHQARAAKIRPTGHIPHPRRYHLQGLAAHRRQSRRQMPFIPDNLQKTLVELTARPAINSAALRYHPTTARDLPPAREHTAAPQRPACPQPWQVFRAQPPPRRNRNPVVFPIAIHANRLHSQSRTYTTRKVGKIVLSAPTAPQRQDGIAARQINGGNGIM